ncbi:MAG TPA: hypothetical protein VHZ03_04825 [Trebonia sp.]|nr:hypothetical protein [Trebonia sp.]
MRAWRSVDRGTCKPGYRAAKEFADLDALLEAIGDGDADRLAFLASFPANLT